jgi:hypothetical protein
VQDFVRLCRWLSVHGLDGLVKLWGRCDSFGLGEAFRAAQIGIKGDGYEPVETDSQPFTAGTGFAVESFGKS